MNDKAPDSAWPKLAAASRFSGASSRAWDIAARAKEMEAQGADIIHLSIGDPDFDTPAYITEAAIDALKAGRTHYPPGAGESALREAIAEKSSAEFGHTVKPQQIVVFPGAQSALFAIALSMAGSGDEIILQEPTYTTYKAVAQSGGATAVTVPADPLKDYQPDIDRISQAITPATRGILINTPNNPSGAVFQRGALQALVDLCRHHNIWLISDEVYANLVFQGEHISPASLPGGAERTFVVQSLSKSHAMTGWRLGWTVSPSHVCHQIADLVQSLHFGVNQFVQDAATTALTQTSSELENMKKILHLRRNLLCSLLQQIPRLKVHPPAGGMFLVVQVDELGMDGNTFASRLLEKEGVALVPGFAFGESMTNTVRIGYLREEKELTDASHRIARFVSTL